jgi:uncharacterized protein GlcG (DUF336 family)
VTNENQIPDTLLSEETRQMTLNNATLKAYGAFLSELTAPSPRAAQMVKQRQELCRRLATIAVDMDLSGNNDATIIRQAITMLGGADE